MYLIYLFLAPRTEGKIENVAIILIKVIGKQIFVENLTTKLDHIESQKKKFFFDLFS